MIFFKRMLVLMGIVLSLLGVWTLLIEPARLVVRREGAIWRGPAMRVVLLSDLHVGSPHVDTEYLRGLVAKVNELQPDLVLLAGDFLISGVVGGHPVVMGGVAKELAILRARLGVFSVLGNHDWWGDAAGIRSGLESAGIKVLENESLVLMNDGMEFRLVGIGDDMTGHSHIKEAMDQVAMGSVSLLFTHDPGTFLDLNRDFDLALAGHMHGGQVQIPFIGPLITPGRAPRQWAKGWTKLSHGPLFVSSGVGTSILPVRLFVPPEIVMLELKTTK